MKKIAQKNKKMTMAQILKNYNDVLDRIKTLNQTKSRI